MQFKATTFDIFSVFSSRAVYPILRSVKFTKSIDIGSRNGVWILDSIIESTYAIRSKQGFVGKYHIDDSMKIRSYSPAITSSRYYLVKGFY